MAKASRTIQVGVSKAHFFDVISDYESYPSFLSTLQKAKVLERKKNVCVVRFDAKVIKSFSYTLELIEKPPTGLSWRLVEGDFMKTNNGRWKIQEKGTHLIEATYEIEVELGLLVPSFVTKVLVEESLPTTLEEFRKRAEEVKKPKKGAKKSTSKNGF